MNSKIKELLLERGIQELTDVQNKVYPAVISGKNILAIAPTGFGKTEAALLPIFEYLYEHKNEPIALVYITPLRALNRDLLQRMEWWCEKLGISIAVRHGDTSQYERSKQLKKPPQMLITTPETLNAVLPAPKFGLLLKNVKWVVVDEIHEFAGDKRGTQLSLLLERLAQRADFKRVGLSATIGNPEEVAKFLVGKREVEIINTISSRKMDIFVVSPIPDKNDEEIGKKLHLDVENVARLRFIKDMLSKHKSVLTFVNTRSTAEILASRLSVMHKFSSTKKHGVHHGSLSKEVRISAEKDFKDQKIQHLIATSSLELGIDIGSVDLVLQYMSPRQVNRLMQRVGRSGHRKNLVPKGIVIAQGENDILESAAIVRRVKKGELENIEIPKNALDVLANQIVGILMDLKSVSSEKIYSIVSNAYPFSQLTFSQFNSVLKQLSRQRLIWLADDGTVQKKKGKFALLYYFENLSMIPDEKKMFVLNVNTNQNISMLDEQFVVAHLEIGTKFITKGMPWRVLDISEKEVLVEPSNDITAAIPDWEGEEIPVPFEIAREVGEIRKKGLTEYSVDLDSKKTTENFFSNLKQIPDNKTIVVERLDSIIALHTCFGTKVNETLARMIAAFITSKTGAVVGLHVRPYIIFLESSREIDENMVINIIKGINPEVMDLVIDKIISQSSLFRYRFLQVAKRFGLLSKNSEFGSFSLKRIIGSVIDSPVAEEAKNEVKRDYLDLENTKKVLNLISKNEITLISGKPSALTEHFLKDCFKFSELVAAAEPTDQIIDSFMKQILEKDVKLGCTYCGNVWYSKIQDLPQIITCAKCEGQMITMLNPRIREQEKAFKEKKGKYYDELMRIASMINASGKYSIIALNTYGIGPETSIKIYKRHYENEREFFKDLLNEQKRFIRTRRYWELK